MGESSFPGSTFCADTYSVSILPSVTTVALNDPGHSAKSAGGRLQLNTKTGMHPMYVAFHEVMWHGCMV